MPLPFLHKGHAVASQLLHKAGLTLSQIPQAKEVTRDTVEAWFSREMATGNTNQAFLVLKGQVQEKGPKFLYNQLQEAVLLRLIILLGIRSALASNVVALLLPFVLKRVYAQVSQNSKVQAWWQKQTWKQRTPSAEVLKSKMSVVKDSFKTSNPKKK